MTRLNYSVLMSVWHKEKPENLEQAIASIIEQTVRTDDFVLVCDGPLTDELDEVIARYQKELVVIRLSENVGLGNALSEGIVHCKNQLIARMDSDDISMPDRCERQLKRFEISPDLDVLSGTVLEFDKSTTNVKSRRKLPQTHKEICRFSKRRNPFNHPAVMFKKESVLRAGGYRERFSLFEDYDLWVRMLKNGCRGENLAEPLLYMRTSAYLYMRRGGRAYAGTLYRFYWWMKSTHWITWFDYITSAVPHGIVCVLPNGIRKTIYGRLHK